MIKVVLLIIPMLLLQYLYGQNNLPLRFENINQNNGLSNNQVTCFYKDEDGFMWFGTGDGLNRFDGTDFKIYRHETNNKQSLVGNQVMNITKGNDGHLWIASHCWGLSDFNTHSKQSNTFKENKNDNNALYSNCDIDVLKDDDGNYWVKNSSALSLYHPKTKTFTTEFKVANDSSVIYNFSYQKGIIWLGLKSSTIGFNVKTKQIIPSILSYNNAANATLIINFINDSIVFSSDWEKGFFLSNINTKKSKHFFNGYNIQDAKIVTLLNKQQIWISSNNGLYVANWNGDIENLTEKSFTLYQHNDNDIYSLSTNDVRKIYQDNNGIIWLATSNGINKFNPFYLLLQPKFFSSETINNSTFNYFPHHFFCDTNSKGQINFWFSNWHGAGLVKTDANFKILKQIKFKHYDPKYISLKASQHVSNVFKYAKDTLCIATWDGLWLYDELNDKLIQQFKFNDKDTTQPKHSRIDWAIKDRENNIWVGTYNQNIRKLNPITHNWQVFQQGKDIINTKGNRNDLLFLDSKNRLWLSEVSYYDFAKKQFTQLTFDGNANDIREDKQGNIWLATEVGLAKFIEATNSFKIYNTSNGLKSNQINKLCLDKEGNLWATSSVGLICINENKDLLRVFTVNDGLLNNNTNNVLYLLPNGNLLMSYYGESNNAYFQEFNPEKLLQQAFDLPFHFTNIQILNEEKIFETSLDSVKTLDIGYKQNLFSTQFKALDFGNASNVRYRYKLIGLSNYWIDLGNKDNITFTNLGYDTYLLEVQATNSSGIWMTKNIRLKIIVHPPFWRTIWFEFLIILLLTFLILIVVKRRINAIKVKAALKQQLTDLEMKALRSQMNPHFIFNCLSSIQSTIMQGEVDRATDYVDKFSLLLRTVLNQSERTSITLQEEIDYLTTYLELECFRYEDLQFTVNAEKLTDAAFIHIPSMLLQPFIENAIQHGLSHKIGEKKINVLFEEDEKFIKVTIQDNGIGRAASKEINKNRSLAHQSLGIKNIEDRLTILFNNDKAKVEFVDKEDGTDVVIEIPII